MPFVNGKYYMNPQYGRAMERARTSRRGSLDAAIRSIRTKSLWPAIEGLLGDESQSPSDSETNNPPRAPSKMVPLSANETLSHDHGSQTGGARQHEADDHWVTINQQHVLIHESHGSRRSNHARTQQKHSEAREHKAEVGFGETAGLLPLKIGQSFCQGRPVRSAHLG
jgi:hypothetical protein